MDAFYASAEQRDDRALRGTPVSAVMSSGGRRGPRGVVATAIFAAAGIRLLGVTLSNFAAAPLAENREPALALQ